MKKSNFFRVLVAMLLVAALLVPSFAMAEDATAAPKVTVTYGTDNKISADFVGYQSLNLETPVVVKAENLAQGDSTIDWTVTGDNVTLGSTTSYISNGDNAFPTINLIDVGTATITGRVYTDGAYICDTNALTVETKVVPVTKVSFNPEKVTIQFDKLTGKYGEWIGDYDDGFFYETYDQLTHYDLKKYVKVEGADATRATTYDADDLVWESSDDSVARVYQDGKVQVFKDSAGKPVTITATEPHSGVKGTFTLTVTAAPEKPEESKVAYEKIYFTATEYTMDLNKIATLDLGYYVRTEPVVVDDKLIWESSDPEVATVDVDGIVTAIKAGDVTITAYSFLNEKVLGTAKVSVKGIKDAVPFTDVHFFPASMKLYFFDYNDIYFDEDGDVVFDQKSFDLGQYVKTAPAKNDDWLVWTSSNPEVARVDEFIGKVTLNGLGTTTITARSGLDGKASGAFVLEVIDAKEVAFKDVHFTDAAKAGRTYKISAMAIDASRYVVIDYADGSLLVDSLKWASSNASVATVDEDGIVYFQAPGKTTITVRSYLDSTKTDSFELTVEPIDKAYTSLSFVLKEYTITDEQGEFNARKQLIVDDTDMWGDHLIWTSQDLDTAYVTDWGVVHAQKTGDVVITVRSAMKPDDVKAFFTLHIVPALKPITGLSLTQNEFKMNMTMNRIRMMDWLADYINITPIDYTKWYEGSIYDGIIFTSDNPEILEIYEEDGEQFVLLKKPGEAKITGHTIVNLKKVHFNVTVEEEALTHIYFLKETPETMTVGHSINMLDYVVTKPYDIPEYKQNLTWQISEPQLASIYPELGGLLVAEKPGEVIVTVTDKTTGKSAFTKIKMVGVNAEKIVFIRNTINLKINGDRFDLTKNLRKIVPDDCSYDVTDFVWNSSKPEVANVDYGWDDEIGYYAYVYPGTEEGVTRITAMIRNSDDTVAEGDFYVKVTKSGFDKARFSKSKYDFKVGKGGAYEELYFTVTPADASVTADDFVVTTSKATVATASIEYFGDGQGVVSVYLKKPGTCKITLRSAVDDSVLSRTTLNVTGIAVKSVKLKEKTLRMNFYQLDERHVYQNIHTIYPIVNPSNAWYTVKWETSNAAVAFVNQWGTLQDNDSGSSVEYAEIIATGEGTATLKMIVDDGNKVRTAKLKVIVTKKEVNLKLNKKKVTINMIKGIDNVYQLGAIDADTDEPVKVKWSSSDKSVATVDSNGLVTAKKAGIAIITATTRDGNDTSASCTVVVNKKKVESLTSKSSYTMKVGADKLLSVRVKPGDAYNTALKFRSSDKKVVTVDENGKLNAVGEGTAIVTVKTMDGSGLELEIEITVVK